MAQVLQGLPPKAPSFGQQIAHGLASGGVQALGQYNERQKMLQEEAKQNQMMQQENEAVKNLVGFDMQGVRDPRMRQKLLEMAGDAQQQQQKQAFEMQGKQQKLQQEQEEKVVPLKGALERVNEMKYLRKKGNLGRGIGITSLIGGEAGRDKGAYETLGNSLISYATNIPIRNKIEFEKLAGRISDPSITDAEAEGILDSLEQIINNSLAQYQPQKEYEQDPNMVGAGSKKEKPPLSSFHR